MNSTIPHHHSIYLFTRPPFELAPSIACNDWGEPLLRDPKIKRVPPARLHFTLYRLGAYAERPRELIPKFEEIGEQISNLAPTDVTLDWLGQLGLGACVLGGRGGGIAGLRRISRKAEDARRKTGLNNIGGATSVPHLTLVYPSLGIEKRRIDPIKWRVCDFILVDSLHGLGEHVELNRWRFNGPEQLSLAL
jgi:2'-5' RNA ligase